MLHLYRMPQIDVDLVGRYNMMLYFDLMIHLLVNVECTLKILHSNPLLQIDLLLVDYLIEKALFHPNNIHFLLLFLQLFVSSLMESRSIEYRNARLN